MAQAQVVGAARAGEDEEDRQTWAAASDLSEIVADDPATPTPTARSFGSGGHVRPGAANGGASPTPAQAGGAHGQSGSGSASGAAVAQNSEPERAPTRESLSDAQRDAILVRMHEEEFLMANFRRWIHCFSLIVCLLTPAMLGIMIWMMVENWRYQGNDCDVPLQMWCMVLASIVFFNATLNLPTRNGSFMVRFFCMWAPDPQAPRRPPLRVRIYNAAVTLFIPAWNLFGLYLILFSGNADSPKPPCEEAAPGLYESVKVWVVMNLTFTVFFYVNMVGFSRVLGVMLRRGIFHSSRAAPKGTMENGTEKITPGDEILRDQASCSVCLEEYDAASEVVRVKACGHIFHRQCLQGWLNVNRNCPICRRDLVDPTLQP
eukprot:CAMPEP_0179122978 /NCGR_PEP_ID=MMETSP0796-20121207/58061_1 /TAXON_ID=73915 /ORGANISM="Pyrodinium bahamense, Strain pbaha01" /LENGTH=374 /DNA_ID=CAMNT_0020821611 /DNA_START=6 /DNA_END=1130 /DNA_ORIENTATION=+